MAVEKWARLGRPPAAATAGIKLQYLYTSAL